MPSLRVRVLGSAAGGGLPQWNCGCANCCAARAGTIPSRTQSSIAVTADGVRWLLVNASPDVRQQVQWLAPKAGRGSGIAAIALTSADIDHAAGLFVLREGGAPPIYATAPVRRALDTGLGVLSVLSAFGAVDVRPLVLGRAARFMDREGRELGFEADVVGLSGRPPPYMRARSDSADASGGDTIALVFRATGGSFFYAPGLAALDAGVEARIAEARVALIDGTCFSDDEVAPLNGKTSRDMGHVTIGGADGSLAVLARHANVKRAYAHINNTNPILMPGTRERAAVEAAGVIVAEDGLELEI